MGSITARTCEKTFERRVERTQIHHLELRFQENRENEQIGRRAKAVGQ